MIIAKWPDNIFGLRFDANQVYTTFKYFLYFKSLFIHLLSVEPSFFGNQVKEALEFIVPPRENGEPSESESSAGVY